MQPIFFENNPSQPGANIKDIIYPQTESRETHKNEKQIYCRNCGAPVTSEKNIHRVNGKWQHTFFNPQGKVFHIHTFNWCQNILVLGQPITDWTWFPPHAWQMAQCASCSQHLGWFFTGQFWGLIADHLK